MSVTSILINLVFSAADRKRDRGLQTPADIERRDNLAYGPAGKWQRLDVYLPRARSGRLPVIVNIHGGGWAYGSKEVYQYYCMSLAQHGFAVVNFNYRLAPAHKFPAPLEDTNAVLHWMYAHAAEHDFDLGRVFLVGDSAGANTAAAYACLCINPAYAALFNFQVPRGFRPAGLALNCGVYRPAVAAAEGQALLADLLKDYLGSRDYEQNLEKIDVCRYVNGAFPPTYLMTAEFDFVKAQAPLLLARLEEFQVRHQYRVYGNGSKEIGHVFHCNIRLPEARACNDDECAFFSTLPAP